MDQREEFVRLATSKNANVTVLCKRFGISRKTGYKWLNRYSQAGQSALKDQSRRPRSSPQQTSGQIEQVVVTARKKHPKWGGRKLRTWLLDQEKISQAKMPAASTITAILHRRGLIDVSESKKREHFIRFEREAPNDLWQMDFKGHFPLTRGSRCHPLTVLDDHSRFVLALRACSNELGSVVQGELTKVFRRSGLPAEMLMDNGPPWGDSCQSSYSWLSVWLMRLGVAVTHGRPHHPQTQGKDERFHRTLKAELLCRLSAPDIRSCQRHFDHFRDEYNFERPHEALGMVPPIRRYQNSPRSFPEILPPIEYGSDLDVRKVGQKGWISFKGAHFNVGMAFQGMFIGLRPAPEDPDRQMEVRFCRHRIGYLDLVDPANNRMVRCRSTG